MMVLFFGASSSSVMSVHTAMFTIHQWGYAKFGDGGNRTLKKFKKKVSWPDLIWSRWEMGHTLYRLPVCHGAYKDTDNHSCWHPHLGQSRIGSVKTVNSTFFFQWLVGKECRLLLKWDYCQACKVLHCAITLKLHFVAFTLTLKCRQIVLAHKETSSIFSTMNSLVSHFIFLHPYISHLLPPFFPLQRPVRWTMCCSRQPRPSWRRWCGSGSCWKRPASSLCGHFSSPTSYRDPSKREGERHN